MRCPICLEILSSSGRLLSSHRSRPFPGHRRCQWREFALFRAGRRRRRGRARDSRAIHLSPYMASSNNKDDLSKSPISEILPISRPGYGTKGQQILVKVTYEGGQPVTQNGLCRNVINKLQEIYASDVANMNFAYDGDKSLFTPLAPFRMSGMNSL
ncbi:hypothetical protein ACP70R_034994 [Stipagrostis hirtigluma subsp. patula]